MVERRALAGLVAARARLADVVEQRGQPGDTEVVGRAPSSTAGGRTFSTTAIVWLSTSLWRWIGSCSSRRAGSSGRKCSARPVSTQNHRPAAGWSSTISLSSSSRIRSADTISQPSGAGHDGGYQAGLRFEAEAGDEAGGAQHAQRVVAEADLRGERGAQDAVGQVERPAVGIDQHRMAVGRAGQLEGDGVDREVAPSEIVVDRVGERHLRLARVVDVDVGAKRRDLERSFGAVAARRVWPRSCRSARPAPRSRWPSRPDRP